VAEISGSVKQNAWVQAWARLGFAAGGIVYLVIGILAILVAFGNHGRPEDAEGAIAHIGSQPFGHILLAVVTAGLFGYAAWCFIQAIFDTDRDGNDVKGLGVRIGEVCSGIAYLSLGVLALHRMRGLGGAHHNSAAHWTAKLLAHSWGAALVALLGGVLAIVGIGQIVYGVRERFRKYLRLTEASVSDREWIVRFGKWGYSAQGIVFLIVGGFLVSAALYSDPRRARGLDGALQWLAQQAYGPWLLGIVAAGLGAYGLFMLVEARYRRLT
jgi:hypothetical protein